MLIPRLLHNHISQYSLQKLTNALVALAAMERGRNEVSLCPNAIYVSTKESYREKLLVLLLILLGGLECVCVSEVSGECVSVCVSEVSVCEH